MLVGLWVEKLSTDRSSSSASSAKWVMHMAFASGVIFIGHCQLFLLQVTVCLNANLTTQSSAPGRRLSCYEPWLNNFACNGWAWNNCCSAATHFDSETYPHCVHMHALCSARIDAIPHCRLPETNVNLPLSSMVQQSSWFSGQHTFTSHQEEIASPSCIMQVSHDVQAFNCCLFVHSWESLSNSIFSLAAFLL